MKAFVLSLTLAASPAFAGVSAGGFSKDAFRDRNRRIQAEELDRLYHNIYSNRFMYVNSLGQYVKALNSFRTIEGYDGIVIETENGSIKTIIESD
jgi:hypothetical protein